MLSLERMTRRSGRGLGARMRRVDGGLSGEWMERSVIVADSATVLVMNGHYSFCYKQLFLPGFQGTPLASASGRKASLKMD
ncbi:hypothetical protein [Pseudomonas marginalis]|uniref:hypothetical protein n=1 Tax=Pseudomonas fluorescens group TaxID=136843 RepID=UPI001F2566BF|nr:hypothetical protein [Pseudomonas marginalis]MCF5665079.1 hypothetical protein [Pseudomonas marginalis]